MVAIAAGFESAQLKYDPDPNVKMLKTVGYTSSLIGILIAAFLCCRFSVYFQLYVYEGAYTLLEYAIFAMLLWVLVEVVSLIDLLVSKSVFQKKNSFKLYFIIAWELLVLLTTFWACFTGSHYSQESATRKSMLASVVLLPLLATTNALNLVDHLTNNGTADENKLWKYTTQFLSGFEGLFIVLIYFLFNSEFRSAFRASILCVRRMDERPELHIPPAYPDASYLISATEAQSGQVNVAVGPRAARTTRNERAPNMNFEVNIRNESGQGGMLVIRPPIPGANYNNDENADNGNNSNGNAANGQSSIQSNGDMVSVGISSSTDSAWNSLHTAD